MGEGELFTLLKEKASVGKIQKLGYPYMWGPNAHDYKGFWVDDSDSRCFSSDEEVDVYKNLIDKVRGVA